MGSWVELPWHGTIPLTPRPPKSILCGRLLSMIPRRSSSSRGITGTKGIAVLPAVGVDTRDTQPITIVSLRSDVGGGVGVTWRSGIGELARLGHWMVLRLQSVGRVHLGRICHRWHLLVRVSGRSGVYLTRGSGESVSREIRLSLLNRRSCGSDGASKGELLVVHEYTLARGVSRCRGRELIGHLILSNGGIDWVLISQDSLSRLSILTRMRFCRQGVEYQVLPEQSIMPPSISVTLLTSGGTICGCA